MIDELQWKKFAVLDDGFVCLVDVMGDDSSITQAARVSFGEGTKHVSDDRTLIRYLMRHRHTSPFEMAEIKLLVRVPMDTWRQWIRHRTANVNECSTRYSEAIDSMAGTRPGKWRLQASGNKQGSGAFLSDVWPEGWKQERRRVKGNLYITVTSPAGFNREIYISEWHPLAGPARDMTPQEYLSFVEADMLEESRHMYWQRLELGVAREQARKDLPLSTYTEAYWKCDLHNVLHFLQLRMASDAQQEIREYATIIGERIVKPLFPLVWEAFEDYRRNAVTFTGPEIAAMKRGDMKVEGSKREQREFEEKLERIKP